MSTGHRTAKFTFVELVAVIVVIAVLLAIVAVANSRLGEKRRRVNCSGALHCIGSALNMYASESPGEFYLHNPAGNDFEPLNMAGYLEDSSAYGCPSARPFKTLASDSNFYYAGSGLKHDMDDAATQRTAYDSSGNHPDNSWMNVLFADGHVEGAPPDGSSGWNTYP